MKVRSRRLWVLGAMVAALILITLFAAPNNGSLNSGSTYGRAPHDYGAWYAFMEKRQASVERWRKPFEDLADQEDSERPMTLLRVNSSLTEKEISDAERDWVQKGNTLIVLGVRQPVTAATFSSQQDSAAGKVKIETRRRAREVETILLGDRFGGTVWQEPMGKGRVIFATTPYLAANAYQDEPGNYEFLAQLVTQQLPVGVQDQPANSEGGETGNSINGLGNSPTANGEGGEPGNAKLLPPVATQQQPVFVDEYSHGYKDRETIKREVGVDSIWDYLGRTPLFPVLVQGLVLLVVLIWSKNRRFGPPLTLTSPTVNNSEAYIEALAGVLRKANSTEFVVEVVGKEEQLQLQAQLGLGQTLLDEQTLVDAWVQQTGRSGAELKQLLQVGRKRRLSDTDLLRWLDKWQHYRHPFRRKGEGFGRETSA
jgi:hypothetical protein